MGMVIAARVSASITTSQYSEQLPAAGSCSVCLHFYCLSSSVGLVKGRSSCRPKPGRKSEWAGWKLARGPDELPYGAFLRAVLREEQVHMPGGEMMEAKKGNNRDTF